MKLTIVVGLFAIFVASINAQSCQEVEPWADGEVECDGGLGDGEFALCAQCKYTCPNGQILQSTSGDNPAEFTRECHPVFVGDEGFCSYQYLWFPEDVPSCVNDPNICQNPPFWEEVPPGDIAGLVDCGSLTTNEENYPVGHVCTYSCPDGYHLVGEELTVCTTDPDGGFFTPRSPCCQADCEPTDVLFVIDWSTSMSEAEWNLQKQFAVDVTEALKGNRNLRFGLEVFGQGVRKNETIPFQAYSADLIKAMMGRTYNYGNLGGTHIHEALDYATDTMFGDNSFGQRDDAENVVLFVTDGVCAISGQGLCQAGKVTAAANRLHAVTKDVISVGIGIDTLGVVGNRQIAKDDLAAIASKPENNRLIEDFGNLQDNSLITRVLQTFCTDSCFNFDQLA